MSHYDANLMQVLFLSVHPHHKSQIEGSEIFLRADFRDCRRIPATSVTYREFSRRLCCFEHRISSYGLCSRFMHSWAVKRANQNLRMHPLRAYFSLEPPQHVHSPLLQYGIQSIECYNFFLTPLVSSTPK